MTDILDTSNFKSYPSIENAREKIIKYIIDKDESDSIWVVCEKIHGCNFQIFITEDKEVLCGKRTSYLQLNDKFYNFQRVFKMYSQKCIEVFNLLKTHDPSITKVTIFGELFGGTYPAMPSESGTIRIMKEIYYSPNNEWMIFDIHNGHTFIPYLELIEIAEKVGLPYLKPLYVGPFKEAITYNEIFPSTIPALFNLKDVENNFAEGIVIRPNETKYFGHDRVILKKKHPNFQEIVKSNPKKSAQTSTYRTELIGRYVNENRLNTIESKRGKFSKKDFIKLVDLFTSDVLDDIKKDDEDYYTFLTSEEKQLFNKELKTHCGRFVSKNLQDILLIKLTSKFN